MDCQDWREGYHVKEAVLDMIPRAMIRLGQAANFGELQGSTRL